MNGPMKSSAVSLENGILNGEDSNSEYGDSRDGSNLKIVMDVPFGNEASGL